MKKNQFDFKIYFKVLNSLNKFLMVKKNIINPSTGSGWQR
jgi:hypothetical protein